MKKEAEQHYRVILIQLKFMVIIKYIYLTSGHADEHSRYGRERHEIIYTVTLSSHGVAILPLPLLHCCAAARVPAMPVFTPLLLVHVIPLAPPPLRRYI